MKATTCEETQNTDLQLEMPAAVLLAALLSSYRFPLARRRAPAVRLCDDAVSATEAAEFLGLDAASSRDVAAYLKRGQTLLGEQVALLPPAVAPSKSGALGDALELTCLKLAQLGATVTLLADKGASIDHENWHGDTPLALAASNGHVETVTLLVEKGASIGPENKDGDIRLITAIRGGHAGLATQLIRQGASLPRRVNDDQVLLALVVEAEAADASGHGA